MEFDLILWLNTLMKAEHVGPLLRTHRLDSVQHARQHHSKKSRVKSRLRRDLQSINDTVLDDRGDSTEDIVSKGDMELGNMAHGVYQETTIEITHEAAARGSFTEAKPIQQSKNDYHHHSFNHRDIEWKFKT
ncbi:hypothetical protein CNMCM5623_001864 [Aspergillus felis]|uniref:Uncharacterized protein n=1 Tax=Aspergillus felis TaxID=1287682 RepID=A0A8H6QBH5_9EURO|nr:hypothetical protein CNMCM5623_001864 [Aspergillus felis]